MKNIYLIIFLIFLHKISLGQTLPKNMVGLWESTSGSDWIALKENGTGKLCITNNMLPFGGCLNFTWEYKKSITDGEADQININYQDPNTGYETTYFAFKQLDESKRIYLIFPPSFGFGESYRFIKKR